jgi:glutaredoxin 3
MSLLQFSKTYKPFHAEWAVETTKKHEEIHWTEDEADLSEDVNDWKTKLSDEEKDFITNILRLFTQGDVQVGQNYYDYLIPKFKNNEVRVMLGSFASREGTHQRAYALLNDTLGLPDEEYHKFLEYSEMSDKIEFMSESDPSTHSGLALALAKSVLNEGVSLFASFVMLLNLQRFGKMKGMGTIVEWSIRDETMHVEGNSRLFREFITEHPKIVNDEFKAKIYQMARDVVSLEDKFIDLAFKQYKIEGISAEEVKEYIRYITDRRLLQLGLKPNFNVKDNPLEWLDWILNGASQDNFFEKRVTEYSVVGMSGNWEWKNIFSV